MSDAAQFLDLVVLTMRMHRQEFWFILVIHVAMTVGFLIGFGYFIGDVSEQQALYLTTGTATNALVIVGLVDLPNVVAQAKAEERLDYFLALPIRREIYIAAHLAFVALVALPGIAFALALGTWHYDISLHANPALLVVFPLAVLSLAGVGVAVGVLSPVPEIANMFSNLTIFYAFLFAPVLIPVEQLPSTLQHLSRALPPGYAADAVRASLTTLPETHLGRSVLAMAAFTVVSVVLGRLAIGRRS